MNLRQRSEFSSFLDSLPTLLDKLNRVLDQVRLYSEVNGADIFIGKLLHFHLIVVIEVDHKTGIMIDFQYPRLKLPIY